MDDWLRLLLQGHSPQKTYYSTFNENYSSIWPCCAYKLNNFGVVGRSAKN
jgi:hypothetical protein